MFVTAGRIIASAWINIARNLWLSATTVFVLMLALLSVNVVIAMNVLANQAVGMLEDKIDVSVYFKRDTVPAVLDQAKFFLTSLPQVKSVEILTPEQSLEQFKERHVNDPKILSALTEIDQNPLGATLVIKADRSTDYGFLVDALKNPQFGYAIESQNFADHSDLINQIRAIGYKARMTGYILVLIFGLFAMLLVYNVIRVSIYTQREEISVMRLVGASSSYVRIPFVLQGLFLGIVSLGVASVFLWMILRWVDPQISLLFEGASTGLLAFYRQQGFWIIASQGVVLSLFVSVSSWIAAGKYLKT